MSRNKKNSRNKSPQMTRSDSGRRETRGKKQSNRAREVKNTVEAIVSDENDVGWHNKFKAFMDSATKLPFAVPLGSSIRYAGSDPIITPGVMAIDFIPTPGYSKDQKSAVNRSASAFRTYLRSVQKASADYNAADIMIILLAYDSLYSFHQYLSRAYRVINLRSPMNKYYPEVLLTAMGIDPSIRWKPDVFRTFINQLGINLTRFVLPASFDINARHQWMCEGIYRDAADDRAQTYLFKPVGFWCYDSTNENGSSLVFKPIGTSRNPWTLDQLIDYATELLNAVSNDDDVDTINGDLYAAFGTAGMKPIAEVKELEVVAPVYDPVVLSSIENATLTGGFYPSYSPVITQDPSVNGNGLIFTPQFAGNAGATTSGKIPNPTANGWGTIMNMHLQDPSGDAILEASYLMASSTVKAPVTSVPGPVTYDIFGSDVATIAHIFYYREGGSEIAQYDIASNCVLAFTDNYFLSDFWGMTQAFDWSPMLYLTLVDESGEANVKYILADIDNLSPVTNQQLNHIHEASLLSLFEVPQFAGKISTF